MKNILKISLAFSILLGAVSCNMELRPVGSIDSGNAIVSLSDIARFRTGWYTVLRGYTSGTNIYSQEQQSDLFHATLNFGNRGGDMYRWQFTVANGEAQSAWSDAYVALSNINYTIQNAIKLDRSDWSDEDNATFNYYMGEAYFLRAFYHHQLAMRFCLPYEASTAESYGIPYVKTYAPTSDNNKYPDRGTLEQTYVNIMQDIEDAEKLITVAGTVGSQWITADAVAALKARVALHYQKYDVAIAAAEPLIEKYPLVANQEAMTAMWKNDSGDECILQLWGMLPHSMPGSSDAGYISENVEKGTFSPDYIPEKWLVDLYSDTDLRTAVYFKADTVLVNGDKYPDVKMFYKFDCNPEFQATANDRNYNHKNKIFRVAEMHLVLAEAYARIGGKDVEARNVLNNFRTQRDAAATPVSVGGQELLMEILNERTREFAGEGLRLNDLRRFKVNVKRSEPQDKAKEIIYTIAEDYLLEQAWNDHRATWPIPQAELDANPKLRSEQNAGYNN